MNETHEAEVVIFRKFKRMAPDFHRVMVYEVEETIPSGAVTVTDRTKLEFR